MLFLALKKVQMVKITSCQILTTQQKNPPHKISHCPDWWDPPIFHCILKNLNCPFAPREDFLGKLGITSITLSSVVSHHTKAFQKKVLRADHEI